MSLLRKEVLGRNVRRYGLGKGFQNLTPLNWTKYFDKKECLNIDGNSFHYYKKGDSGPAIVCLHGGGYSGLTWALFSVEISDLIECQIICIDLRGHGNTKTTDDTNLSLETLAKDVINVITELFPGEVPIILVGHSMGGAVAVEVAQSLTTTCLCVIDVVEGTALDALSSMQSILRGRPSHFLSIQQAILWCYKSGQTHNLEAARISMPGQIINTENGNLAANETYYEEQNLDAELFRKPLPVVNAIIEEDDEDKQCNECGKPPLPKSSKADNSTAASIAPGSSNSNSSLNPNKYTWRINLSHTEVFWNGWFKGLSEKFLSQQVPKLLLLANINGLDTTLTVGQMQGKFQLQVLNKSGHAIHEDQPHNVAEILSGYLVKQKIAIAKCSSLVSPMPGC